MYKFIGIAINEYDDPLINNLNNCLNDIEALVQILSQKYIFDEFEILKEKEQTTKSFIYNRLFDIFSNALKEDNYLIYFAGHGIYHSKLKSTYWQTSDSKNTDIITWLNLDEITKFFEISESKHIALISDSCFSGGIFETNRGGGITALENKISRQALTSGSKEKVLDGKSKNSPFNQIVVKILSENMDDNMSFIDFSQKVILNFNPELKQTPIFGSLENTGHDGGSFTFKTLDNEPELYKEINLPLRLHSNVNVDGNFVLPQFLKNDLFDNEFINSFISQLGNSIISDTRSSFNELKDEEKNEVYSLDFHYHIKIINSHFLSILFTRNESYTRALHPNDYFYTLNFTYQPERKISVYDVIDMSEYSSQSEFILFCINNSDEDIDIKEELLKHFSTTIISNEINRNEIDFTFNEKYLNLYLSNHMPRVSQAIGFIDISLEKLKLNKRISDLLTSTTNKN